MDLRLIRGLSVCLSLFVCLAYANLFKQLSLSWAKLLWAVLGLSFGVPCRGCQVLISFNFQNVALGIKKEQGWVQPGADSRWQGVGMPEQIVPFSMEIGPLGWDHQSVGYLCHPGPAGSSAQKLRPASVGWSVGTEWCFLGFSEEAWVMGSMIRAKSQEEELWGLQERSFQHTSMSLAQQVGSCLCSHTGVEHSLALRHQERPLQEHLNSCLW